MFGKPKVITVRLSDLTTNPRVNRPLNPARVDKLVKRWDDNLFAMPVVAELDGKLVIVDGQHRIQAMREQRVDDPRIQVFCHYDLSEAEAARLFVYLNENLPVRHFDKFEKLVFSGEPTANAINAKLLSNGLKLAQGQGKGSIQCVTALQRAYGLDKLGEHLESALKVIIEAWGRDAANFQAGLVEGLAILIKNHGATLDRKRLVRVLTGHAQGPHGVIGKARTHRADEGGHLAGNVAEVVLKLYDKGLRKKIRAVA